MLSFFKTVCLYALLAPFINCHCSAHSGWTFFYQSQYVVDACQHCACLVPDCIYFNCLPCASCLALDRLRCAYQCLCPLFIPALVLCLCSAFVLCAGSLSLPLICLCSVSVSCSSLCSVSCSVSCSSLLLCGSVLCLCSVPCSSLLFCVSVSVCLCSGG